MLQQDKGKMSSRHSERQVEITRSTRSGRKLTYCLRVIQQPERARACGSGAKSSADRRPVDPPPVVELRVFEGDGPEKEDITFSYEANFFLYASLELARPSGMAHPRGHQPPPQQPVPVLTGMPVSGMAYLDRPVEAGYFIFPDLSVRHEGRYKLSFNLYEQTKREQDLDADPSPDSQQKAPNGPHTPDSSFDFRVEVKSSPFMVWSAKKFPGLRESTTLSRQVAEQGCRVRIRRDVRMRRRTDGKPGQEYDETYEDPYARGRGEDGDRESRSRSSSASASDSPALQPNGQPYYQSQPGNNLSFIPPNGSSQFAAPPAHFAPPQPVGPPQHQSHQPPPPPSQHYQPHQPPAPLYRQPPPPPPPSAYPYDRQYPQSAYPSNPPRESFEQEQHRRASVPYPSSNHRDFPPVDPALNRPSQSQYAPRPYNAPVPQSPVNIPPLKSVAPIEPKYEPPKALAPVPARISQDYPAPPPERNNSYSSYSQQAPPPPPEPARAGGKRAFDTVFKNSASSQPLYNGMRPATHVNPTYDDEDDDDGDEYTLDLHKMSYKRADGNFISREIPNKI